MRIEVDGQHFEVPDDASLAEIDAVTKRRVKVSDPALLARLNGKVTDPALLSQLGGGNKIVQVPGLGNVEFPGTMTDDEIGAALSKQTSEKEMMADLATADAAGDTQLAQHIAGRIKALRAPQGPQEPSWTDRLRFAAHRTAGLLPAAGGIAGGAVGGGLGGAVGFPTTGPGGILTTAAGAGVGAGIGSAGGRALQHAVDSALGYEQDQGTAETIKDSAKTGARDGAFTAAGSVIAPTIAAAAGKLAPALDSIGNRFGRRVLAGGATPLSVKKPISADALDAANDAGAFRPFGTTHSAAKAIEGAREVAGTEYSRAVSQMEAAGVNGPDISKLAEQYVQRLATAKANSFNPSVHSTFGDVADQLGEMSDAGQSTLRLSQAENLRRSLQDDARAAYQQLAPRQLGKAKQEAASMLRQSIEDAVSAQSAAAPDEAAAFVPVKRKLGGLIEAGTAADKGVVMADRRHALSPTDYAALIAGAAHGHSPIEAGAAMLANKALRTYGPSTAAWASKGSADLLERLAALPSASTSQAGAAAALGASEAPDENPLAQLADALRRRRLQAAAH